MSAPRPRPKRDPKGPDKLKLRRHLQKSTPAELEEIHRFWSPHDKNPRTRDELVERLRRLMSDESVVHAKVDLLSEKVREVLLALLRKDNYASDLQGLYKGVDGLEFEHYEAEAALTALSRRGFVRVQRARDWLHYGRNTFVVPVETARVLRGLAGTDQRSLHEVFVHASFQPFGADPQNRNPAGPLPDSVQDAIGELPRGPLPRIARLVIEKFGGIITLHEFNEKNRSFNGGAGGRRPRWESRRFVREFTPRGLGTVGHLDLRGHGLGLDDDALVFFYEVVERYLLDRSAEVPQYDTILRGRGDLMSDVVGALTFIRDAEVRVGKDGTVYKAARERMAEAFVFPLQPLIEREELGRRVLTMLQGLGLVETTADGHLALTAEGAEWSHKPLLQKVREAYDALCHEGQKTLRSRHSDRLRQKLAELLAGDEQEAERNGEEPWTWGLSLAMRARNRYLIDLAGEKPSATPGDLAVRHGALTELGLLAQDLVLKLFFPLGLVDVAMRGDEAVAVRLSSLGRRLFSGEPEKDGERPRPIIINPDFEMIVLPEGDVDDLLHALDRIAVRVKQDEVVHCRLDQQRVQRASVEGFGSDRILALLRDHSRAELPQNVEYSIRTWCQDVRSAKLERGILCTVSDPAVVDTILGHPTLKGCVAQVVTPTALFLNEKATEKKFLQDLRALGVHVVT